MSMTGDGATANMAAAMAMVMMATMTVIVTDIMGVTISRIIALTTNSITATSMGTVTGITRVVTASRAFTSTPGCFGKL